jgi:ferrochelatase
MKYSPGLIAYFVIAVFSFLINIPFGVFRERTLKFSAAWFFWIHASIPLMIYLRLSLGTSPFFIPVCIGLAILGQVIGSRWMRRAMSIAETERLRQVSDIDVRKPSSNPSNLPTAVVLLNMGGPNDQNDVAPFLLRLFSDPRLIRFPGGAAFQPLLARLIVLFRSTEARRRYALIGGGSPVIKSTEAQRTALADELARRRKALPVFTAFNYSHPDSTDAAQAIKAKGITRIVPISLYPQYAMATTGSSVAALKSAINAQEISTEILPVPDYSQHPAYIEAISVRIRECLRAAESLDDFYLLFSAHGLPLYTAAEGEQYPSRIAATTALVLSQLNRRTHWSISYQSAAGPLLWLRPYTEDIIPALARRGVKKLIVVPVSFISDHIETLCEVDIEYRELAVAQGITDFRMSRAVEAHPLFIKALADSIESALNDTQK